VKTISRSKCSDCEFYYIHGTAEPLKKQGIMMTYNQRYCLFGKNATRFSHSDPKRIIPAWCSRQLRPPMLRIYKFKNMQSHLFHVTFNMNFPSAHRYKLCYETQCSMTLEELTKQISTGFDGRVLSLYEVIEFDDGIRQMFFYKMETGLKPVAFDKANITEKWEEADNAELV